MISQMLGIVREEAEQRGDMVQTVYTNDLNIKPCIGCMALEYLVQAIAWCHPCHARDMPLFRL